MKKFFFGLYEALDEQRDFVLVSVVSSSGSTPRGNGAKMAVFADGSSIGTIGGGEVEYRSIQMAAEALKQQRKHAWMKGFNLNRGQTADLGMICGGQVEVCFQYIAGDDENFKQMMKDILALPDGDTDAWLITCIKDGAAAGMGFYERGRGLRYLPQSAKESILPYLKSRAVLTAGKTAFFVEPLTYAGLTWVFGGGHVSQALIPVIAGVDFKAVVYEDRAEFADIKKFPGAQRTILADYTKINEQIQISENDFVVIMTRGHQSDYEVLSQVLRTPAAYIGVIGSRTKMALTRERLLKDGFSEQDFARLHTPIGLKIKAETPAEIAVSVAAEMILCRALQREEKNAQ